MITVKTCGDLSSAITVNDSDTPAHIAMRILLALLLPAAVSLACHAQTEDLTTPYIDFVYNAVASDDGGETTYSLQGSAELHNTEGDDDFDCFSMEGFSTACQLEGLEIAGVDEQGFTLFRLKEGETSGTILITATDNGLWAGFSTVYYMSHKQVSFEACLPSDDGDYLQADDWGSVTATASMMWNNGDYDNVAQAPTGSYDFGDYGTGATVEGFLLTDPADAYAYYTASFVSPTTSQDYMSDYTRLNVGEDDHLRITVTGLEEGQAIGLRNVTLRERVSLETVDVPCLDVALNLAESSTEKTTRNMDSDHDMEDFSADGCVASCSMTGAVVGDTDEQGFTLLTLADDATSITINLRIDDPSWALYRVDHYQVSYDVFLRDATGYLTKDQWGAVSLTGSLRWNSTSDKDWSDLASMPSQSETVSGNGTRIVAERTLTSDGKYYSVYFTSITTVDWTEITDDDEFQLTITGLTEGQTVGLRGVTLTERVTYDDVYTNHLGDLKVSDQTVSHKPAKWYGVRERTSSTFSYNDTYDDDPMKALSSGTLVQATHEMVDTIFMRKGTSMDILIPQTKGSNACSVNNYFRWFNYLNDKNLYCGDVELGSGSTDLITPVPFRENTITAYRFANGYVAGLLNTSTSTYDALGSTELTYANTLREVSFYYPTDDEFALMQEASDNFTGLSNDYYAIACDVSIYNDFSTDDYAPNKGGAAFSADNGWCEPTLAARDVYYIVGIDDEESDTAPADIPSELQQYWKLFTTDYQGGGNDEASKYLEEYEITMPSRRISTNTDEIVALTKDAQSYAMPGDSSLGSLAVSFAEGEDNGLTLVDNALSGTNRTIAFYKGASGEAWTVDDGSTATILVTKTVGSVTYNLVRYKLTFKDEATPLTEAQVHSLDDVPEECQWWWKDMYYRSPSYIENNYKLITSLGFDYGGYGSDQLNSSTIYKEVTNATYPGQVYNYPYPLKWDNCSYGFYDGSYDVVPNYYTASVSGAAGGNYRLQTLWCMYDIVNYYVGYGELWGGMSPTVPAYPYVKNHDGYWLYVDASDRPGTVAELTFENNLCEGAQIVVTAWIKSDSQADDDAAVLLTVTGVSVDNDGNETRTPIYRQYSGQIEVTQNLSEDGVDDASISGKGGGTNEWFQTYFTFNNSGENYDYYTVRVDNYCASTAGGDFYFDEVCVYARNATLQVEQANSICSTSETEKSLIKVDVDYESILQYITGNDPSTYLQEGSDLDDITDDPISAVDFVVIDRVVYEDYLAAHLTDNMTAAQTEEVKEAALTKAAALIYPEYDATNEENPYGEGTYNLLLNFHNYYYKNPQYNSEANDAQLPYEEDGKYYFYYDDSNSKLSLTLDLYVDFTTYTDYAVIMESNATGTTTQNWQEVFADLISSPCAIGTEFYIIPFSTIVKIDGEAADPTVTACVGQTVHIEPEVDFSLIEGDAEQLTFSDDIYFDWFFGTLEEYQTVVTEGEETNAEELSSLEDALDHFRSIYSTTSEPEWTEDDADEGYTEADYEAILYWYEQGRLLLRRKSLDVTMSEADTETAGGIRLVIKPLRVTVTDLEGNDISDLVCWEEVTLCILADGGSPTLSPGFSYITGYPADYIPCLRLGSKQALQATGENTAITVSLRGASYADGASGLRQVTSEEDMNHLFLVSTDDPAFSDLLNADGFSKYSIPLGTVSRLTADKETDGGSMEIYFNFDEEDGYPAFKEGYSYYVSVYFEEDTEEGSEPDSCLGAFPLEIKVVPEYLVWQGDETANWNDDSKWHRATAEELNNLPDYDDGTTSGFAPMSFSKVVIPEGKAAELYMSGFSAVEDEEGTYEWKEEVVGYEPAKVEDKPTENIMYDLIVCESEEGELSTQHFRSAMADQLHLEAGAMLLHPELLLCDKLWTDVKVPDGAWLLTSTPLDGVVAGDWYTGSDGTEPTPYFTDIELGSDHSRLEPLVFQRGWGSAATMVYVGDDDEELPAYASTAWTSVYNNASATQPVGAGFSVEAELPDAGTYGTGTDSITFRFPKADTEYTYQGEDILRTGAGKLLVSDLSDRSDIYKDADPSSVYPYQSVSVTLTPSPDGYCLIGNPFTARMSLRKFFESNEGTLLSEYWLETTEGPVSGSGGLTSLGEADALIEPYSAFFAKTSKGDGSPVTVLFTHDMQTLDEPTSDGDVKAFLIKATSANGVTGATVQYAPEAQDGYCDGEDAVLIRCLTEQTASVPLVYTVASGKAVSVNRLRSLSVIPLGVYADDDEEYTLSFHGISYLSEPVLYDALEGTKTPLEEIDTLSLQGSSHGRLFILTSCDPAEESAPDPYLSVSSRRRGEVSVSAADEISRIEVYSAGGLLLCGLSPESGSHSCTLDGLPQGLAIVRTVTALGVRSRKVLVR